MMNDENITFLFYPFKLYEKFIIDELFRFSLAVSAKGDKSRTSKSTGIGQFIVYGI